MVSLSMDVSTPQGAQPSPERLRLVDHCERYLIGLHTRFATSIVRVVREPTFWQRDLDSLIEVVMVHFHGLVGAFAA
jgi:hypothetical protein